jgi:hypothetical protein
MGYYKREIEMSRCPGGYRIYPKGKINNDVEQSEENSGNKNNSQRDGEPKEIS